MSNAVPSVYIVLFDMFIYVEFAMYSARRSVKGSVYHAIVETLQNGRLPCRHQRN